MKPWYALIVREWLEHRSAFVWGPAVAFAIVSIFVLLAVWATGVAANSGESSSSITDLMLRLLDVDRSDWSPSDLERRLEALRVGIGRVFVFVYFVTVVFVLAGMLHDERRDRSVLFFKSMPVGDAETVLAKLVTAVWVAPLATIAATVATWLVLTAAVSIRAAGNEHIGWTDIWQHAGLIGGTVDLLVGFLVQGLWALPLYGWLLFVSSAVRAPLLWATLVPAAVAIGERLSTGEAALTRAVAEHFTTSALPHASAAGITGSGHAFGLFATLEMWAAIAVGAALIAGAIAFRRRNNEL